MRAALVAAIVVLLAAPAWAGGGSERWPWSHVRWSNESGRALLLEGGRRSAVVRNLLEELEHSDVIVYLTGVMSCTAGTAGGGSEGGVAAHLSFAAAGGGMRYLHITLDTWRAGGWDAIPLLGHELQHALEVASAPEVKDVRSFERFYFRIGWRSGAQTYETELARATGRRIQEELLLARAPRDRG